jgi:hypothetical protein
MIAQQGTEALVTQLADEIIKRLDKSYDLVYVDYRDQLTDSQVSKLARGEEWVDESWEWEADNRFESAEQIIDELARPIVGKWSEEADDADLDFVLDAFKYGDEWDRVRFEIEERDTGGWVDQLVRQTPSVLLRISAIDEDHGYAFQDVKPRRVLKDLGLRATRENVKTVSDVLAECSPEYSVLLGYWIVGADVSDLYELPISTRAEVEIVNPYLYLGNPFMGSGFISERPLQGTVRVKREDLRTDEDAFGYSVDQVYGGLRASDFEAAIRPVETTPQPEE